MSLRSEATFLPHGCAWGHGVILRVLQAACTNGNLVGLLAALFCFCTGLTTCWIEIHVVHNRMYSRCHPCSCTTCIPHTLHNDGRPPFLRSQNLPQQPPTSKSSTIADLVGSGPCLAGAPFKPESDPGTAQRRNHREWTIWSSLGHVSRQVSHKQDLPWQLPGLKIIKNRRSG